MMERVTAELFTDGMLVYATIQGRRYALGPVDSFEMDHPKLYKKIMARWTTARAVAQTRYW